jgi:hypothetical protein
VDRRYSQARAYDGTKASRSGSRRQEALVRARLAQARVRSRSLNAAGNEGGPKSAEGFGAADILRARAQERQEQRQVFEQEGSGVYGARPAMDEIRRRPSEAQEGLLGGW